MKNIKFGWIPDLPDIRDHSSITYGSNVPSIATFDAKGSTILPTKVDLRQGFSPVENQGNLGSCTAQAGVALVEYMERKFSGKHIEASRLFLYKNTRRLAGLQGDSGGYLRDTIKALRLFGVSQEQYWPYDISKFDNEPDAFNYALANNYKSINYFRVDVAGISTSSMITEIKSKLCKGIPFMFGSTVYDNIFKVESKIPFPTTERAVGGHAMVICGYDDNMQNLGTPNKGAFLIRNSWGTDWGMQGYAWMPYDYLRQGLMVDIWGITKQDWVDTTVFN